MEKLLIEVAPGLTVEYIEHFYTPAEANELLRAFLDLDMSQEIIRLYGRDITTKRSSAQYGAHYKYNPLANPSQEWTPLMGSIRERVELVTGPLHGALVQVYPNGSVGIGWHRDAGEPEVIVSLSFGAERDFVFGVGTAGRCVEVWRMGARAWVLAADPRENERSSEAPAAADGGGETVTGKRHVPEVPVVDEQLTKGNEYSAEFAGR